MEPSDRTRGSGHKPQHRRFQLNGRKEFFTLRVAEPWDRLPREGLGAPALETFPARLAVTVQPAVGDPAVAGGCTGWSPGVPHNPDRSVILYVNLLKLSFTGTNIGGFLVTAGV